MSFYRQQPRRGSSWKTGAFGAEQSFLHMAIFWTFLYMAPFTFPASLIAGLMMGAGAARPTSTTLLAEYSQVFFKWWPQGMAWCFPRWNTARVKVVCAVPRLVAAGFLMAWRRAHKSSNWWAHFLCQGSPQISCQSKTNHWLDMSAFSPDDWGLITWSYSWFIFLIHTSV